MGRTSLKNLGGITSKGQEDGCIWYIVSMKLCREMGEKSDRRVGQWTGESEETVRLSKFERMVLVLSRYNTEYVGLGFPLLHGDRCRTWMDGQS